MADQDALIRYFDLLKRTLEDNELGDKPCQIFTMDETGMPLDLQLLKCVFSHGERNPVNLCFCVKTQITVAASVSAAG